jgi:hypothetical protein
VKAATVGQHMPSLNDFQIVSGFAEMDCMVCWISGLLQSGRDEPYWMAKGISPLAY